MARRMEIQELPLWDKLGEKHTPLSFELELTARCNLNCRHCYINLPVNDQVAKSKELTLEEIYSIADQAVDMGLVWCLLTGGEPLLRPDFMDIYLSLRKKGFLLNVFTNACLINENHIKLFNNHPPRDIEVTVYGVTQETYEGVTSVKGSYQAFKRGLDLLLSNGLPVTLKAMALKSNQHEIQAISDYCRERTKRPFRFDPFLHLRYDGDPLRNEEIKQERLTAEEIVHLETDDQVRIQSMEKHKENLIFQFKPSYDELISEEMAESETFSEFRKLFRCGIGNGEFTISSDGKVRLCSALCAPGTTSDHNEAPLKEILTTMRNKIRAMDTESVELLKTCKSCKIVNLCMWCPAIAYLETGDMEGQVPYFCQVAHARAESINPQ